MPRKSKKQLEQEATVAAEAVSAPAESAEAPIESVSEPVQEPKNIIEINGRKYQRVFDSDGSTRDLPLE